MKLLNDETGTGQKSATNVISIPQPLPQASTSPISTSSSPGSSQIDQNGNTTSQQKRKAMLDKNHRRNGDIPVVVFLSRRKRPKMGDEEIVKVEPEYILPDTPPSPPGDSSPKNEIQSVDAALALEYGNKNGIQLELEPVVLDVTTKIKLERVDESMKRTAEALVDVSSDNSNTESTSSSSSLEISTAMDVDELEATIINSEEKLQFTNALALCEVASTSKFALEKSMDLTQSIPSDTFIKPEVVERIDLAPQKNSVKVVLVPRKKLHSVDLISKKEREDIAAGKVEIPGIPFSFMDLPDIPPPPKVNYLKAGLLSTFYKISSPLCVDEASTVEQLESFLSVPLTKETICPLVVNTRTKAPFMKESDYQLPYDIYCFGIQETKTKLVKWICSEEEKRAKERIRTKLEQRRNSRLSLPALPKIVAPSPISWTFKRLRKNAYSGMTRPVNSKEEDQTCECPGGENNKDDKCVNDDCLNRVVFTECPDTCGDNCKNRRIQKHLWAPQLKKFMTKNKGYGIKTLAVLNRGDFILEYIGDVVPASEFRRRMLEVYANDTHHYCLQLDSGLVIDGHRSGDIGRFVNHSCEPNCEMQKWSVNGLHRMALFALQDILPGEELCYDYNFSLYNETEGQPCYCRSSNCRGVIGVRVKSSGKDGKQRGRRKNASNVIGLQNTGIIFYRGKSSTTFNNESLTKKDIRGIRDSRIFLTRNYKKVGNLKNDGENDEESNKVRQRVEKIVTGWAARFTGGSTKNKRQLVLTDEDPKVATNARIAQIFFELYYDLTTAKGESGKGKPLCQAFLVLPSKSEFPVFHQVLQQTHLQGLQSIGKSILEGRYESFQLLEEDIRIVFTSFAHAYETEKPGVILALDRIKDVYKEVKTKALQALEPFIVYSSSPTPSIMSKLKEPSSIRLPPFVVTAKERCEDETILRCICGIYVEEGMLVQCDKCLVWQHCDCVRRPYDRATYQINSSPRKKRETASILKSPSRRSRRTKQNPIDKEIVDNSKDRDNGIEVIVIDEDDDNSGRCKTVSTNNGIEVLNKKGDEASEPYYCELCEPREVNLEVPMDIKKSNATDTYYLTLLRDDGFLVRRDDTVYVLRDYPEDQRFLPDGSLRARLTYHNAGPLVAENCDILRIDKLWIDNKGNRMVMGTNFFRPAETHHERSRRFYPNEILRAPVAEIFNIDYIHGRCWVLDTNTYCLGRPKDSVEEHVYICDLRVNKTGRVFDRIGSKQSGISTKSFAFNYFQTKLKINRNVYPHGPPIPEFMVKQPETESGRKKISNVRKITTDKKQPEQETDLNKIATKKMKQTKNLEKVIAKVKELMNNKFNEDPIDLSHLLTKARRARKYKSYKSMLS